MSEYAAYFSPEEEEFIASVQGLWGKKVFVCDCVGKSGVPKRSFGSEIQARKWKTTTKRRGGRVYQCEQGRWHITSGRKRKKKAKSVPRV